MPRVALGRAWSLGQGQGTTQHLPARFDYVFSVMNDCPDLLDLARTKDFDADASKVEHQMRLLQALPTKQLVKCVDLIFRRLAKHSVEGKSYRDEIARQHPDWPARQVEEAPYMERASSAFAALFWMPLFLFEVPSKDRKQDRRSYVTCLRPYAADGGCLTSGHVRGRAETASIAFRVQTQLARRRASRGAE